MKSWRYLMVHAVDTIALQKGSLYLGYGGKKQQSKQDGGRISLNHGAKNLQHD